MVTRGRNVAASRSTVRITVDEPVATRTWRENLGSYSGGRLFTSAAEVEAYLQEERDSWE